MEPRFQCSVLDCELVNLPLFGLPKDTVRRSRWMELCGIHHVELSKVRVCAGHFDEKDYFKRGNGTHQLRNNSEIDPHVNLPSASGIK